MVIWHIKLTRMTSRTECKTNYIIGSNWKPWGQVKGQISLNSGYHVNFQDFFILNCVCVLTNERYKTFQTGFLFCLLGHAPGVGLWGTGGAQGLLFFKHGHLAYQIDGDDEQD